MLDDATPFRLVNIWTRRADAKEWTHHEFPWSYGG